MHIYIKKKKRDKRLFFSFISHLKNDGLNQRDSYIKENSNMYIRTYLYSHWKYFLYLFISFDPSLKDILSGKPWKTVWCF